MVCSKANLVLLIKVISIGVSLGSSVLTNWVKYYDLKYPSVVLQYEYVSENEVFFFFLNNYMLYHLDLQPVESVYVC